MCSFGFITCYIRADFQDTRRQPVLPADERSECDIARTDQIGMEAIMATLTPEEQGLVGNVALQLGKGPPRGMLVCPPLLPCGFLACASFCPLPNVGQVFQAEEAVRELLSDAVTDAVVHSLVNYIFCEVCAHPPRGSSSGAP